MMVAAAAYSVNNMVLIYILPHVKLPIYAVLKATAPASYLARLRILQKKS